MMGLRQKTAKAAVLATHVNTLLWERDTQKLPNQFGTVVYGHTPQEDGVLWNRRQEGPPHSVGVDVGAVFKLNPLTAVRIDDWTEICPG